MTSNITNRDYDNLTARCNNSCFWNPVVPGFTPEVFGRRLDAMQAVQLVAHGRPGRLELREVPDPKPGPGKVLVEVQSCGLNHLDLWLEQGDLPIPLQLPRTPGGEIAGRILEVAGDVPRWRTGDEVAVQSNLFCGHCPYCQRGEESMCLHPVLLGVERDGGLAEGVC